MDLFWDLLGVADSISFAITAIALVVIARELTRVEKHGQDLDN